MCVFPVACLKIIGSVYRVGFYHSQTDYGTICSKKKTLESVPKKGVSRATGNPYIYFFWRNVFIGNDKIHIIITKITILKHNTLQ
jgi:hypothetical protein